MAPLRSEAGGERERRGLVSRRCALGMEMVEAMVTGSNDGEDMCGLGDGVDLGNKGSVNAILIVAVKHRETRERGRIDVYIPIAGDLQTRVQALGS